jgi:hypothetical protein
MAGFLDKRERVVDMVLTSRGKLLLSQGNLNFVYWVVFDDEIDYTPFLYGTDQLSEPDLSALVLSQVESALVREATTGYREFDRSGSDHSNVFRPLFTMPQGQQVLPRMRVIEGDPESSTALSTKQTKVSEVQLLVDAAGNSVQSLGPFDRGYDHSEPEASSFELGYSQDGYPPEHRFEGFLVRVYDSGSEGFREIGQRHDLQNDSCYNDDMKIYGPGVATTS